MRKKYVYCCVSLDVCLYLPFETGGQMLEVDISHQGQNQQSVPQGLETPEQTTEPPKQVSGSPVIFTPIKPLSSHLTLCLTFLLCYVQSTKTGWFSGWFKSKPKDVQKESSEQGGPAQTVRVKYRYIVILVLIRFFRLVVKDVFVHFLRRHHPLLASVLLPHLPWSLRARSHPSPPLLGSIPFQGKQVSYSIWQFTENVNICHLSVSGTQVIACVVWGWGGGCWPVCPVSIIFLASKLKTLQWFRCPWWHFIYATTQMW